MKDKNHMIILIHAENTFVKIFYPCMIKTSQQSGDRGNIPKHKKGRI